MTEESREVASSLHIPSVHIYFPPVTRFPECVLMKTGRKNFAIHFPYAESIHAGAQNFKWKSQLLKVIAGLE